MEQDTLNSEAVVFRCKGAFDPEYFKRFETNILKSIDKGFRKFIFNWEKVNTLSASGLRLLVLLLELIHNKKGAVVICSVPKQIRRLLETEKVMQGHFITEDEAEAYRKLASNS